MTRRDEMLAVMAERRNEVVRLIVLADSQWWRPFMSRHHRSEARRLLALNKRDEDALPPERYHKPRPGPVNISRTAP